jgi:hypothetical protein
MKLPWTFAPRFNTNLTTDNLMLEYFALHVFPSRTVSVDHRFGLRLPPAAPSANRIDNPLPEIEYNIYTTISFLEADRHSKRPSI